MQANVEVTTQFLFSSSYESMLLHTFSDSSVVIEQRNLVTGKNHLFCHSCGKSRCEHTRILLPETEKGVSMSTKEVTALIHEILKSCKVEVAA